MHQVGFYYTDISRCRVKKTSKKKSNYSYHKQDIWLGWADKTICTPLGKALGQRTKEDNIRKKS